MTLTPFVFILNVLAVWRLVVFIRQDGLIEGTRDKVTAYLMRHQGIVNDKLMYLVQCQWCLSIWFSMFATAALTAHYDFTYSSAIVTWLAMAAAASIVDLIADHL